MSALTRSPGPVRARPARARLAGALLALTLLASGCGGDQGDQEDPAAETAPPVSDAGGGADDGSETTEASDGGGAAEDDSRTAAAVPADPYPVTPPPEDFEAPAPCTGEGAHLAELGGDPAQPALPERAGETLTIELAGIEDDHAQLTAQIGDGEPRPIEDATIGETVTVDLWTISVTSVCADVEQVEFDLID